MFVARVKQHGKEMPRFVVLMKSDSYLFVGCFVVGTTVREK